MLNQDILNSHIYALDDETRVKYRITTIFKYI